MSLNNLKINASDFSEYSWLSHNYSVVQNTCRSRVSVKWLDYITSSSQWLAFFIIVITHLAGPLVALGWVTYHYLEFGFLFYTAMFGTHLAFQLYLGVMQALAHSLYFLMGKVFVNRDLVLLRLYYVCLGAYTILLISSFSIRVYSDLVHFGVFDRLVSFLPTAHCLPSKEHNDFVVLLRTFYNANSMIFFNRDTNFKEVAAVAYASRGTISTLMAQELSTSHSLTPILQASLVKDLSQHLDKMVELNHNVVRSALLPNTTPEFVTKIFKQLQLKSFIDFFFAHPNIFPNLRLDYCTDNFIPAVAAASYADIFELNNESCNLQLSKNKIRVLASLLEHQHNDANNVVFGKILEFKNQESLVCLDDVTATEKKSPAMSAINIPVILKNNTPEPIIIASALSSTRSESIVTSSSLDISSSIQSNNNLSDNFDHPLAIARPLPVVAPASPVIVASLPPSVELGSAVVLPYPDVSSSSIQFNSNLGDNFDHPLAITHELTLINHPSVRIVPVALDLAGPDHRALKSLNALSAAADNTSYFNRFSSWLFSSNITDQEYISSLRTTTNVKVQEAMMTNLEKPPVNPKTIFLSYSHPEKFHFINGDIKSKGIDPEVKLTFDGEQFGIFAKDSHDVKWQKFLKALPRQ